MCAAASSSSSSSSSAVLHPSTSTGIAMATAPSADSYPQPNTADPGNMLPFENGPASVSFDLICMHLNARSVQDTCIQECVAFWKGLARSSLLHMLNLCTQIFAYLILSKYTSLKWGDKMYCICRWSLPWSPQTWMPPRYHGRVCVCVCVGVFLCVRADTCERMHLQNMDGFTSWAVIDNDPWSQVCFVCV